MIQNWAFLTIVQCPLVFFFFWDSDFLFTLLFTCALLDIMALLEKHTWLWSRDIFVHHFSYNTWWGCSLFVFTGCVRHQDFLSHDWGESRRLMVSFFRMGNCTPVWRNDGITPYETSLALPLFQHLILLPAQIGTHKIHR